MTLDATLFRQIVETSHDGILVFTAGGETRYLNDAALHLFDYPALDAAPDTLEAFIPRDRIPAHRSHLEQFLAGGESSRTMSLRRPVHGRRRDGSLFPADISVSRVDHPGEKLLVAVIRDATTQGKLVNELLSDANRDHLTGLANRRRLQALGEEEMARFRRYGNTFSVVMIDIDHFKPVNDEHGHLFGDRVIRRCADAISETLRDCDRAGRWGGEEFQVLLPETDREGAAIAAERIREAVASLRIRDEADDGRAVRITVSCGVDTAEADTEEFEFIVNRADKAMYAAKRAGRNRVVCADGMAGETGGPAPRPDPPDAAAS